MSNILKLYALEEYNLLFKIIAVYHDFTLTFYDV